MPGYGFGLPSNPVGQLIGNMSNAYQLGYGIAHQPQVDREHAQDRTAELAHRDRQSTLENLKVEGATRDNENELKNRKLLDTLNQIKASGGQYDPTELRSILDDVDVPDNIGSDEFGQAAANGVAAAAGHAPVNHPETMSALDVMYAKQLGRLNGSTAPNGGKVISTKFKGLYPSKDGTGLHPEVIQETDKGVYEGPLSKDGQTVVSIPTEGMIQHTMSLAHLHDTIVSDHILKAAFQKAASIQDPAERARVIDRGVEASYANAQGKLVGAGKRSLQKIGNQLLSVSEDGTEVKELYTGKDQEGGWWYHSPTEGTGYAETKDDVPDDVDHIEPMKKGIRPTKDSKSASKDDVRTITLPDGSTLTADIHDRETIANLPKGSQISNKGGGTPKADKALLSKTPDGRLLRVAPNGDVQKIYQSPSKKYISRMPDGTNRITTEENIPREALEVNAIEKGLRAPKTGGSGKGGGRSVEDQENIDRNRAKMDAWQYRARYGIGGSEPPPVAEHAKPPAKREPKGILNDFVNPPDVTPDGKNKPVGKNAPAMGKRITEAQLKQIAKTHLITADPRKKMTSEQAYDEVAQRAKDSGYEIVPD